MYLELYITVLFNIMGKSIGISFGTHYLVVAYKDLTVRIISTGSNNEDTLRSCVAINKKGDFIVGNTAYNSQKRYQPNVVFDVRRLIGASYSDPLIQDIISDKNAYPFCISRKGSDESVVIILNGKEYSPEQLGAEILRQIRNDVSVKIGEVTHVVMTVPAYFNNRQLTAMRKTVQLAGLKVKRLLSEPIAVAISYGIDKIDPNEDKVILVYDFGEKRLDISILVASGGQFIECGVGGDKRFGGDDINNLLSKYVIRETEEANCIDIQAILESLPERKKYAFQEELNREIERAKILLSETDSASIEIYDFIEKKDGNVIDIEVTLTQEKYEKMIFPLIQHTLELVDHLLCSTAITTDTIDYILLAGGSSNIPLVRKMLSDKFGKNKIISSENPMFACAKGAAIMAQLIQTEEDVPLSHTPPYEDGIIIDPFVAKQSYFIQFPEDFGYKKYEKIIEEQSPLPYQINRKINNSYLISSKQSVVKLKIFCDGESSMELVSTVYFLTEKGFPPNEYLRISFLLNQNESLSIKASFDKITRPIKVIMGRGARDSHCCEILYQKSQEYSVVEGQRGIELRNKLNKIIKGIMLSDLNESDDKWLWFEQQILIL